jgi:hypothetical protein
VTGASEWHRAGIAVSGVTLVLMIAAGIHFFAPARPDQGDQQAALVSVPGPQDVAAAPTQNLPVLDERTLEPTPSPATRRRVPAPPRSRTLRAAVDVESLDKLADAPRLATPLVASLEIPEESVRFEPMRLSVSAEFVEPPLPADVPDDGSDREAPTARAAQRGPVTAALATAGSAVATGLRTAGRAVKRAF